MVGVTLIDDKLRLDFLIFISAADGCSRTKKWLLCEFDCFRQMNSKLLDLFFWSKIGKTPTDIVSIGNWQPKNISDSLGTVYKDEPIRFDRVYQGFRIQSERVLRIQQLLQIPNKTLIFIGKDGPVDITFNEKQSFDNYSDLVLVNRSGDSQWLVHLGVVMRRLPDTLRALDALIEEKDGFEDSWQDSCELGQLV